MNVKKVSFGFKLAAKPSLLPSKCAKEAPKDLIKCLEDQKIKLVEEKLSEAPLIIPMLTNRKTSAALESIATRRALTILDTDNKNELKATVLSNTIEICSAKNLDQRAAYEILEQAKHLQDTNIDYKNLHLPAIKTGELTLNGAKESSINDYESVPIQHFGLAMLRGMGWIDPPAVQEQNTPAHEMPFLRPKGMGLGADKAIKAKALLVLPEVNEILEVKKNAYVRILGGKHKGLYGQIEGFDDHAGRIIVKMAIGGTKEAFNEFMCQPVSKKEYAQYSKCINTLKYEKYKKLKNEHVDILVKKELKSKVDEQRDSKDLKNEKFSIKSYDSKNYQYDLHSYKTYQMDRDSSQNHKKETIVIRPESKFANTHSKFVQIEMEDSPSNSKSKTTQHYREEFKYNELNKYLEERIPSKKSIHGKSVGGREPTQSDTDFIYEYRHKKQKRLKSKKHKKYKNKKIRFAASSSGDEELSHLCNERTSRIQDKDRQKEQTEKSKHSHAHSRSGHRR